MSTPPQSLPDALLKAALARRATGPSTQAELVDDVLAAVESLPQRRGWTWSLAQQRLLPILLAAALLLSALIGFGLAIGGPFQPDRDEVMTERGFVEPFYGLPPEGAVSSRPESGELVLHFAGRVSAIGNDAHFMLLYADGRLIWRRNLEGSGISSRAFGTSESTTALIEQRLSPEGVELLRTAVLEAGEISGVPSPGENWMLGRGPGVSPWGGLLFREGGQLVEMTWSDATLPARLADPATWLPTSAWVDRRLGGYVPTLYAVCFEQALEDRLPGAVVALLASRSRGAVGNDPACGHTVTIPDARLLAAMLDDGGFARLPDRTLLEYRILAADSAEREAGDTSNVAIWFSPVLPHGDVACFGCG